MSELERRADGLPMDPLAGAKGVALERSMFSPSPVAWWSEIDQLPRPILAQMHAHQLFPEHLFFGVLRRAEVVKRNNVPYSDCVRGWLVGDSCVSTFEITRELAAPQTDEAWTVRGRRHDVAGTAECRTRQLADDSESAPAKSEGQTTGGTQRPTDLADTLPGQVRAMLAAVTNPLYVLTSAAHWAGPPAGSAYGYRVASLRLHAGLAVAVEGTRRVDLGDGESLNDAERRFEAQPWNMKVVRAVLA